MNTMKPETLKLIERLTDPKGDGPEYEAETATRLLHHLNPTLQAEVLAVILLGPAQDEMNKHELLGFAETLGPDVVQELYHAVVFMTKVA